MFRCYWVSQTLQQLKNCDLGNSIMLTRLQRRRRFCKLNTKKRRDLQVKARSFIGYKTISTNFTGVLLLLKTMFLLCCAESVQVVLSLQPSIFRCYWVSQPLQKLIKCDLGDSSMLIRLQRRRQFCKLSTKKRRDLQVKARPRV